jgi:hypothetical protein
MNDKSVEPLTGADESGVSGRGELYDEGNTLD